MSAPAPKIQWLAEQLDTLATGLEHSESVNERASAFFPVWHTKRLPDRYLVNIAHWTGTALSPLVIASN